MYSATILVVDDSNDIRVILQRLLIAAGYRVILATNGQEAICLARQYRPELVLLDLNMPVLDGWEAARRIRAEPALDETLIVAMTGYRFDSAAHTALAAGCHTVLFKPFDVAELLSNVATSVALSQQAAQRVPEPVLAFKQYGEIQAV